MSVCWTVVGVRHFDDDLQWSVLMKADVHTFCGWGEVVRASACPCTILVAETLEGSQRVGQILGWHGDTHADQVGRDLVGCRAPRDFHPTFDWCRSFASVYLPGTLAICRQVSLYSNLIPLEELIGHFDAVGTDYECRVGVNGLRSVEISELL